MATHVYPLLDVVVGLEFGSESLARSLARPQLPDDEHVGDGHGDDGQEEDDGGDEAVVGRAQRVRHCPLIGHRVQHSHLTNTGR